LTIAGCRIESLEPTVEFGIEAGQASALSGKANPGKPENFSGTLAILNNDIDVGATAGSLTLGVVIFSVGTPPDKEVDIYVSGNNIRNVTEPAINLRAIGGRAHIERNMVSTGTVIGGAANPDAIRVVGSGSYLIAHNTIDCGWSDGGATGVNVIGQAPPMAAEGAVFGSNSAAIESGASVKATPC
jgi:hypothetical protein